MKSEPPVYGVGHLAAEPGRRGIWTGVRNYQARNFLRDEMRTGDLAFFYHSSCAQPGIAAILEVSRAAFPDPTRFDPAADYFDANASPQRPRRFAVEVSLIRETRLPGLAELRAHPQLAGMRVLARGNRLSITPVSAGQWRFICGRLLAIPTP